MYLFYDDNNKVNLIYHIDLPDNLKGERYFEVDELPEVEDKAGYDSVLMCDGSKAWYEYVERELTEIEVLSQAMQIMLGEE